MKYWFKAKQYGWGWTPSSIEGWIVIVLWALLNVAAFRYFATTASAEDALISFTPIFVLSIFTLLAISYVKGEKPSWRWNDKPVAPRVVFRKTLVMLLSIAIAQSAGLIGTYFTMDAIPTWYATLTKPSFNPPNWLFGPVWVTLYTLMGVAAFFAWDRRFEVTAARPALRWYVLQLLLNTIWTPIFFGAQKLGLAFGVIIALWVAIIITMYKFYRVSPWLMLLLVPYILWVSFASLLNYTLWMLN